ncbi:unnamed protein product [Lymnaea stagnalis]|uniref:Protein-L-isoaspartate O-methyltransferase domain-containing protein 1 n=1 Tax=Lymnaea stagnalis TaxID=6523 RepID=A0AAV2HU01_LYMST
MGGAVSSGQDNDELIDNLKEAEYIKTQEVERVFRIVDRAHYYLKECRENAYKDLAWKNGTLHLSAPCIYSEVMEALELRKGLSFLNLGSGTGYLNTMVGLMIGPFGINHGIELHSDNVNFAMERLESFIKIAKKFDDLELCEPQFVVGNCLNLAPENRLYDRVYCGAACPPELKDTFQNMIKVNGILVIPVGDQLLKIKRISQTEFTSDNILPVSFASLVQPGPAQKNANPILLAEVSPLTLQYLCRIVIREAIRNTFDFQLQEMSDTSHPSRKKFMGSSTILHSEMRRYPLNIVPTTGGLMIMGAFDQSDYDDDEEEPVMGATHEDEYMHRQLQQHAAEYRARVLARRHDNVHKTKQVTRHEVLDVDSNLSEIEEGLGVEGTTESNDINGNKNAAETSQVVKENEFESLEREDWAMADDKFDVEKTEMKGKMSPSVSGIKRQKNTSDREHSCRTKQFSSQNSHEIDQAVIISGQERDDHLSSAHPRPLFSKRSISLSSDDEVLVPKFNTQSPAILVTSSTGSPSQPRAITTSYSTSADTSETSGFGSLGDDALPVGSQHSGVGSFKEDLETMSTDVAPSSPVPNIGNKGSPWSTSSKGESSLDNDRTANDGDDSTDAGWMDMDDDDDDSQESDVRNINKKSQGGISDSEEEKDTHEHSPRGPDFSSYLKEKVHTLPIPSTLKAFILYYR